VAACSFFSRASKLRAAADAHDLHIRLADAIALKQVAHHEGEARRHGIDRKRLALQVGEGLHAGRSHYAERAPVDAEDGDEIGRAAEIRLALPYGRRHCPPR
jgi:hypothetical protein